MRWILTCWLLLGFGVATTAVMAAPAAATAPTWSYRVVATYPHDPQAFTEGLAICDGDLVESDGLYGKSQIVVRSLHTGRVLARRALDADDFGEGVTCAQDRIIQLTWRQGVAYTYDASLDPLQRYRYSGEGWGLTYDGRRLIESDGSATLRFFRPDDFAPLGAIEVRDHGAPVTQLNELEWAGGRLYANVWHRRRIAVIDPQRGDVLAWIDCRALAARYGGQPQWQGEDVLNGIAYDPDSGHLFITGKCWRKLIEIAVDVPDAQAGTAAPQ